MSGTWAPRGGVLAPVMLEGFPDRCGEDLGVELVGSLTISNPRARGMTISCPRLGLEMSSNEAAQLNVGLSETSCPAYV